jgi:uncharacterized membrane protein HdeD (DUF308 family)
VKESRKSLLLTVDSIINLILGGALLFLPRQTILFFGLPPTTTYFYVTVLGAVLFGIGIALWLEKRNDRQWRGLGLGGAIIINVLGAVIVLYWLVTDSFDLPFRGYAVLYSIVVIVFCTALLEIWSIVRRRPSQ